MARKIRSVVTSAFSVVLVTTACAGSDPTRAADDAPTPPVAPSPATGPEAVDAARDAFEAYRDALATRDGAAAVELLTPSSLDHVAVLHQLALVAGPTEISARPTADRLMIATLRVLAPPAALRAGSPEELLTEAVEAGLVGGNVATTAVQEVTVDGDQAAVQVSDSSSPTSLRLVRHDGGWRVDLVAALEAAGVALRELAREAGIAEDELILSLLAAAVGRPVGPEIFAAPGS